MIEFNNASYLEWRWTHKSPEFLMGPHGSTAASQAMGQDMKRSFENQSQGTVRDNIKSQAARDAPAWDLMRARVQDQMTRLQDRLASLSAALQPVIEVTGANTPPPIGYGENRVREGLPPPQHDSQLIAFMREVEMQMESMSHQVTNMTRGLPFDTHPF